MLERDTRVEWAVSLEVFYIECDYITWPSQIVWVILTRMKQVNIVNMVNTIRQSTANRVAQTALNYIVKHFLKIAFIDVLLPLSTLFSDRGASSIRNHNISLKYDMNYMTRGALFFEYTYL